MRLPYSVRQASEKLKLPRLAHVERQHQMHDARCAMATRGGSGREEHCSATASDALTKHKAESPTLTSPRTYVNHRHEDAGSRLREPCMSMGSPVLYGRQRAPETKPGSKRWGWPSQTRLGCGPGGRSLSYLGDVDGVAASRGVCQLLEDVVWVLGGRDEHWGLRFQGSTPPPNSDSNA
ncbi:hypothetical protein EVG20_g6709 [Dentipellis fragilis]|uniref:Uncharacterized protein n=1 Tax=Dentipellis fragilis TaxID=205917 RepID=A0A4Y9YL41_9AGAM|nr:hypothetical protein EVG20_g6709 [Dentipellis fragilis]